MKLLRAWCWVAPLLAVAAGCKTGQIASSPRSVVSARPMTPGPISEALQPAAQSSLSFAPSAEQPRRPDTPGPSAESTPIAAIHYQESLPQPSSDRTLVDEQGIGDVLSREWLAAEIESRNPSLAAMIAAWQAAAQRYPQSVALDDPMLMGALGPGSFGSPSVETAYMIDVSQKLPWFGKRRLRGAVADADADAAYQEAEDSRLRIRLAADMAFFEYFLAARLIEINRENTRVAEEFRDTARARYRVGDVTNQDVLQADLEVAELTRRQLELERMQQVAVARINTLLRRWPDAPLPPPPPSIDPPQPPADASLLWQTALQQRPDLAALAWRIESEEAALELAYKNFYPDFNVFGRYDAFWQEQPLRSQVGLSMNLPIYREKLRAAVAEAQFRVNQRRAEFDQQALEIQYEVSSAAQQVEESRKTVDLYSQRLVPTAEQNVAAARSNYEVNKVTFIDLALTQRQLIAMREKQLDAIVTYHRRLSELDRAVGGPAPSPAAPASRP